MRFNWPIISYSPEILLQFVWTPQQGPASDGSEKRCWEYWNYEGGRRTLVVNINPYPTAFPYGNGMVLHFYQQQESSMTKTVHKVINKGLKTYV